MDKKYELCKCGNDKFHPSKIDKTVKCTECGIIYTIQNDKGEVLDIENPDVGELVE